MDEYFKVAKKIVDSNLCLGCGLCVKDVNGLKINASGNSTLDLDKFDKLVDKNLLVQACPGLNVRNHSVQIKDYGKGSPELGSAKEIYTGWSCEPSIRKKGSSGGVISALLCDALDTGLVDIVIQSGVTDNDVFLNTLKVSRTKEDVLACAGSRYSPTMSLLGIKEALKEGERIAYVGKPCDIVALKNYLRYYPEYRKRIVFTLSFMCAGLPSQVASEKILSSWGVNKNEVDLFDYRGGGWPGYATAQLHSGQTKTMTYQESWGNILGKDILDRCKICPDGTGESADIVCADAWYGDGDGYPEFDEKPGRSLIISRTQIGQNILAMATSRNAIYMEKESIENAHLMQPYQVTRKQVVLPRLIAFILKRGVVPRYSNLNLVRNSLNLKLKTLTSNFIGSFKRF